MEYNLGKTVDRHGCFYYPIVNGYSHCDIKFYYDHTDINDRLRAIKLTQQYINKHTVKNKCNIL